MPRLWALLTIVVVMAGCGDATTAATERSPEAPFVPMVPLVTRDTAALFQTDSLAYALRDGGNWYQSTVGVTLTNRTRGPIYIVNCAGGTGLQLEQRVGDQWQRVWSPLLPLCLSPPIVVPVDSIYRTRVEIIGAPQGAKALPQFATVQLSGEYRIVWTGVVSSYQDRNPFGAPLPLDARVSNRFTLTLQPR